MAALVRLVGGEVGPGLLADVSTHDPRLLPHLPPHHPLPLGDLPAASVSCKAYSSRGTGQRIPTDITARDVDARSSSSAMRVVSART